MVVLCYYFLVVGSQRAIFTVVIAEGLEVSLILKEEVFTFFNLIFYYLSLKGAVSDRLNFMILNFFVDVIYDPIVLELFVNEFLWFCGVLKLWLLFECFLFGVSVRITLTSFIAFFYFGFSDGNRFLLVWREEVLYLVYILIICIFFCNRPKFY